MSYDVLLHSSKQGTNIRAIHGRIKAFQRNFPESEDVSEEHRLLYSGSRVIAILDFFCSLFLICSLFHKGTLKLPMKLVSDLNGLFWCRICFVEESLKTS